jgi:hypothetical protein
MHAPGELKTADYQLIQATPTPTPTATPSATPTPTATPNPNQVAPVSITATAGDAQVFMSTATTGATIFYTKNSTDFVTPTHNGNTATGSTLKYTGGINVVGTKYFSALAYKSGMIDSGVSQYVAQHDTGQFMIGGAGSAVIEW